MRYPLGSGPAATPSNAWPTVSHYCSMQYCYTAHCSTCQGGSMKELTTTSYAILGLLSLRPWSAYDLSKQMKRSLDLCWPRAERAIYYEPKNLLAHGLVEAKTESNGRRTRTVYTITPRGRRALKRWLAQPSSTRPEFESEAVGRALFAEHGSKNDLLPALRH